MKTEIPSESSLLVLPDGSLLVRNVTPELSALLMALQPENSDLAMRVNLSEVSEPQPVTQTEP